MGGEGFPGLRLQLIAKLFLSNLAGWLAPGWLAGWLACFVPWCSVSPPRVLGGAHCEVTSARSPGLCPWPERVADARCSVGWCRPREVSGFVPRQVSPLSMRVFCVATGEGRLRPVIPSRCFGCHLALSWTPSHVRVPACVGLMGACCRLSACCRRRSLGT